MLGVDIEDMFEKYTSSKADLQEQKEEKSEDSLFDDIMFGGKSEEVKIKQSLSEYNKLDEVEEIIKIKDQLINLIKEATNLELEENEKQELISFITNLKDLMAYQKTEDEIAQEFLLHMNVFSDLFSFL